MSSLRVCTAENPDPGFLIRSAGRPRDDGIDTGALDTTRGIAVDGWRRGVKICRGAVAAVSNAGGPIAGCLLLTAGLS